MDNKTNDIDEFSFMNQKSKVMSMKFLGDKHQQTKKLKFQYISNTNDTLAKHMTGWAKEKSRLLSIIQTLQEENARLSCQVALIEGAKSQGDRDKIFKEFEADFNNKAERLEQRKKKLLELDKLVHSFRCIEQEEELSKSQNMSAKSNNEEPFYFSKKPKFNRSTPRLKEKTEKPPLFNDSDDESDSYLSKYPQQRPSTSYSTSYRKKQSTKPLKPNKYIVVPPPQSLVVTNINPFPFNKSSYPPSAAVSAASANAFQQQNATTTTTTTTIKSGQQHKTVQFTPQTQKQLPSKVLKNVQKMYEADVLHYQNLNARRNIPSATPLATVTAAGALHTSNEPTKSKSEKSSKNLPVVFDRSELVAEHKRLVAISLNLERVMLVKKMQLRLCHDHRDLAAMRQMLNSLEGGGPANTTEKQVARKYKAKIRNLKNQIQREKARLVFVTKKSTVEDRAAISIQNLVRGFICRLRLKGLDSKSKSLENEKLNAESENNNNNVDK